MVTELYVKGGHASPNVIFGSLQADDHSFIAEVRVNHNLWPVEDSVRRQILHGDFVQLSVSGPEEVPSSHIQLALCEQEAADSQRFIFQASPTPSPEPTTPIAGADGSGADDSDPERPDLESREEEERSSHSLSLLQRGVQLASQHHPSRLAENIQDVLEAPMSLTSGVGGREVLNLSCYWKLVRGRL